MYNWGMRGDGKGDNFHNGLEIVSITTYPCKWIFRNRLGNFNHLYVLGVEYSLGRVAL